MVPLIISGAVSTPSPPATFSSAVECVGSGNSQLRPRYCAFELLIWVCGLKSVLNWLPLPPAQLASRVDSGVAAATGFDAALAGLMRTEAPIVEKKNRRLIAKALIDFLSSNFVIFQRFDNRANYLSISHMLARSKQQ